MAIKKTTSSTSAEDLQQRLDIMQNKMKSKKSKPTDRTIQKRKNKKLKNSKEMKKKLISAAKSIKNERIKEEKGMVNGGVHGTDGDGDVDIKPDIKPDVKQEKVFNEEGKMVFSKFGFAAQPSQAKKSKKDSKCCILFYLRRECVDFLFDHLFFHFR